MHTAMNNQQVQDAFSAMSDPAVRRKYRADARAAYHDLCADLKGAGAVFPELPADIEVKAVFNTADTCYVALPHIGADLLTDADLQTLQAAGTVTTASPYATIGGPRFYAPSPWVSVSAEE